MNENNEMMTFEEEEIVESEKNNGTKAFVGIGIAGFVLGALVHKYAKPIAKKVKSKFSKKNETELNHEIIMDESDVEIEDN